MIENPAIVVAQAFGLYFRLPQPTICNTRRFWNTSISAATTSLKSIGCGYHSNAVTVPRIFVVTDALDPSKATVHARRKILYLGPEGKNAFDNRELRRGLWDAPLAGAISIDFWIIEEEVLPLWKCYCGRWMKRKVWMMKRD
jgi:hypothetical protein